jgi:putative hydrolase of the HAD superfamily
MAARITRRRTWVSSTAAVNQRETAATTGYAVRAVLFDAAGTLIFPRRPVGETYTRMARAYGVEADAERIGAAFRHTLRHMPAMVFPGAAAAEITGRERAWWLTLVRRVFESAAPGAVFSDFDACFERLFAHYADPSAWVLAAGARELLAALRTRGLRTGMVSNFDHRLPALLDGLGLSPLLDVVVRPADVGAAKPDARIFTAALRRLGIEPQAALYVGDDADEDIAGARAAGLHAVDVGTLPQLAALLETIRSSEEPRRARRSD